MRTLARALLPMRPRRAEPANQIDSAVLRERMSKAMRRRMSDELIALIRRALLCGHAETAKGLWVVLNDLLIREEKQRFPHGRVTDKAMIDALALEIAEAAVKANQRA